MENIKDINYEIRKYLAAKAFNLTAYYDSLISTYFNNLLGENFSKYLTLPLKKKAN
nr:hypothetical protein [Marinitoga lauensis]